MPQGRSRHLNVTRQLFLGRYVISYALVEEGSSQIIRFLTAGCKIRRRMLQKQRTVGPPRRFSAGKVVSVHLGVEGTQAYAKQGGRLGLVALCLLQRVQNVLLFQILQGGK